MSPVFWGMVRLLSYGRLAYRWSVTGDKWMTKQERRKLKIVLEQHWLWLTIGLTVGFLIGMSLAKQVHLDEGFVAFADGLWPEVLGISVTVAFIDRLYRRRDESRREQELRERLLREARSNLNQVALNAINEVREYGWLTGDAGLMKGAFLERANLENAGLKQANLEGADFTSSSFITADLRQARLVNAKLEYTNFTGANLKGANLLGVEYDDDTILPDGSKWNTTVDMARFTDMSRPDFWKPAPLNGNSNGHKPKS